MTACRWNNLCFTQQNPISYVNSAKSPLMKIREWACLRAGRRNPAGDGGFGGGTRNCRDIAGTEGITLSSGRWRAMLMPASALLGVSYRTSRGGLLLSSRVPSKSRNQEEDAWQTYFKK
jgi:hypothetical protein